MIYFIGGCCIDHKKILLVLLVGLELMRVEISLSFYSFSDVVVGRENRDQSLDGGGNTLPNGYVSRGQ